MAARRAIWYTVGIVNISIQQMGVVSQYSRRRHCGDVAFINKVSAGSVVGVAEGIGQGVGRGTSHWKECQGLCDAVLFQ